MSMQGNIIWQIVWETDWLTKAVLLLLLSMSIFCWAIFFYKLLLLRRKQAQIQLALIAVRAAHSIETLPTQTIMNADSLPGFILQRCIVWIRRTPTQAQVPLLEAAQAYIDQTIDELLAIEESYLPFLFSSAAVSPLLGLFGTVWGLIHAFLRISERQSADIVTVAPGISEALITTLFGLVVAIPALIMYHYLTTRIKKLERSIYAFTDRLLQLLSIPGA